MQHHQKTVFFLQVICRIEVIHTLIAREVLRNTLFHLGEATIQVVLQAVQASQEDVPKVLGPKNGQLKNLTSERSQGVDRHQRKLGIVLEDRRTREKDPEAEQNEEARTEMVHQELVSRENA